MNHPYADLQIAIPKAQYQLSNTIIDIRKSVCGVEGEEMEILT